MSIEMVLYLIGVINNIGNLFSIIFMASIVFSILGVISFCVTNVIEGSENEQQICAKLTKLFICTLIITGVVGSFFPSEKTMYMMLATNVSKKSEIPEKVLQAIELKLDEYISDVKDKVKK